MDEWIAVFKSGTHTDSAGEQHIFSDADLDTIAEKYNGQNDHEAPAVIGHPKSNGPAWGWVEQLKRDGNVLYAKFRDIQAEFAEMLKRRMFKKRSISLYPDLTLRHVGFLGAMPPAIKGLPDFAFAETEFSEFEFADKQSFRDKMLDLFATFLDFEQGQPEHLEETQQPDEQAPAQDTEKQETVNMSEQLEQQLNDLQKQVASFQERIAAVEKERDAAVADRDALKSQTEKAARDAREAENKNFVEGLTQSGKLMPKHQAGLLAVLNRLDGVQEIEFGDEGSFSAVDVLQNIVTDILNPEDFSEVATKDVATDQTGSPAAKLEAKIREIMDADKIQYTEAYAIALKKYPELAAEYAENYA